jgi:hypothetical protein
MSLIGLKCNEISLSLLTTTAHCILSLLDSFLWITVSGSSNSIIYLWPDDGLVIEAETYCYLVTLNKINIHNTSCVLTCESWLLTCRCPLDYHVQLSKLSLFLAGSRSQWAILQLIVQAVFFLRKPFACLGPHTAYQCFSSFLLVQSMIITLANLHTFQVQATSCEWM